MKKLIRRVSNRVTRALLKPLEERAVEQQRQLVSKFDRLEKRIDSALAKGQAETRLLAARFGGQQASNRGHRLGARIPRHADELTSPVLPAAGVSIPGGIAELTACSVCGGDVSTPVCEFNRFVVMDDVPDAEAIRADYALCHRCGVVFARRRPVGDRFRFLLERFEETIGRHAADSQRGVKVLGSRRLSAAEAEHLRSRASQPVFVSEFPRIKDRTHLPNLLRDRLAVAAHVEIIGSLVELEQPRVLEIRPRFGAIGASLRRLYGGETFALPLFEVQQLLVREVYGTRADHLLDYESLAIPYEGSFDLVVANHLLTHAVRPCETLATIRKRLAPGGYLYLYNEPDERDFLETSKSIFATLNAFHLQTFDSASVGRALLSAGFEPIFIGHYHENCVALARMAPDVKPWDPIAKKDLTRRLAKYAHARDMGILSLPETRRGLFLKEWEAVVERAFAAKAIDFDGDGNLRVTKDSL
jgi:SAM-dependent methyltransferase